MCPKVKAFFEPNTRTVSYVVVEPEGTHCAVIDPVLDFDPSTAQTSLNSSGTVVAWVREQGLRVDWILETHCHADHLTAASHLQQQLGGKIGTGRGITSVQRLLRSAFNPGEDFASDGSQFDQLFDDGDTLMLGELVGRVLATPGHTPGCVTYVFGDGAFTGDTLLMPDGGSGRCDFPGGDAGTLYRSIRRILSLPPQTRLFAGHDYAPGGRGYAWESTVSEQRETNIHANDRVTEAEFVALRSARDQTLAEPALMRTAVPFNVVGGRLAALEANGASDLKPPLVIP